MSNAWRWSRVTSLVFSLLLAGGPLRVFSADNLQTIRARRVLFWGADAAGDAPYVFPDPQKPQQLTGFEFDLAEELAAKLGVKARMVQNQWDQLVPGLERGNFDIILNGLELTPENQQQIAMSQPYYVYAEQIVTRKDMVGLDRLNELKGKPVGVFSYSVAQRLLEQSGGMNLKVYPGNVESLRDLKAQRIDAVVMDLPIALHYAQPDPDLMLSGAPFAPGYYGIGVRKNDTQLLSALNDALSELGRDGILERIYRKYSLWDERQKQLGEYRPVKIASQKQVSTLREWPRYLPLLLRGAAVTVELSVLAMALAVVAGLVIVLLRLYAVRPINWLARAYVEVIRGTPLLIQLFLIYYGLP